MSWYQYTCTISRNKSKKVRQGFWHIFMRNCSISNTISLVCPGFLIYIVQTHLWPDWWGVWKICLMTCASQECDITTLTQCNHTTNQEPESLMHLKGERDDLWYQVARDRRRRGTDVVRDQYLLYRCHMWKTSVYQRICYLSIPHLIPEMKSFTIGKQDILIW